MVRFALLLVLLLLVRPNPAYAQDIAFAQDIVIAKDREQGTFAICHGSGRVTCVVDGDTIWYRGAKIRLLDINTPETSRPSCDYEADLGAQAAARLLALLNEGPFSLEVQGRDTDRYGRLLRVVSRNGQSLGAVLVAEGLAEEWQGRRGNWCA